MDPSVGVAEDASVKGWVLTIKDRVLLKAVALAVGAEDLQALVAHYVSAEAWMEAAMVEWTIAALGETYGQSGAHGSGAALAMLKKHGLGTEETAQLEFDILLPLAFSARGAEAKRLRNRVTELMDGNKGLLISDRALLAVALYAPKVWELFGVDVKAWDAGHKVTEESLLEGHRVWHKSLMPPYQQQYEESPKGARREVRRIIWLISLILPFCTPETRRQRPCYTERRASPMARIARC